MTVTQIPHLISGERMSQTAGTEILVRDPSTGDTVAVVHEARAQEVDDAVTAASTALDQWAATPLSARARIMFAFREAVWHRREDLARTISREHGKMHDDALGEVDRGIECIEHACGLGSLLRGERSVQVSSGVDVESVREPVGVVAGITPYNFPAMVPLWMFPLAVAAGNTFVLKPSERDPSPSLLLAELFHDAGLPDGVLNVLQGSADTARCLVEHPGVDAVSFVGSTPVARSVHASGTAAGKRVQALGGAKNHMIVLPDADVGSAAAAAVSAAFGSAGQRCMAVSVVVAVGDVADELVHEIAERAQKLRIGAASEQSCDVGPLITAEHRDRVRTYVDAGVEAGAEPVVERSDERLGDAGYFLGPVVLDRVTPDMVVYRDEIFGPVLSIVRSDSIERATELVNASPFGNGCSLFTRSGAAARWFSQQVHVGMVGINVPIPVPVASHSFGGWKDSLFGSHAIYGPAGLDFYTRRKVVTSRWDGADGGLAFPGR